MLKVMTIVDTRPELIRLSRVTARLEATVNHVLCTLVRTAFW
jgi:UDP-N-acetylglucosamine 2-epimerase